MGNKQEGIIGGMPASSFSFAMSTGIISVSALIHHHSWVSYVLMIAGLTALLALGFLYVAKIVLEHRAVLNEFHGKNSFFGFFTVSAGIDVIATRMMISYIHSDDYLFFTISVGLLLLFSFALAFKMSSGQLRFNRNAVTSNWLNVPVAFEASAITMAIYFQETSNADAYEYFFIFALILLGLFFYAAVNFVEVVNLGGSGRKTEFSGMFFVNMGAGAILSLASLELLRVVSPASSFLTQEILTLLFAAGAIYSTLWLPIVAYKYFTSLPKLREFRYRVSQWAIVFPLGMYSVTTYYLSEYLHVYGFFNFISNAAFAIALAAWALESVLAGAGLASGLSKAHPRK